MGLSTANKLMKKFGKDPQKVSTRFNSILLLTRYCICTCTCQLCLYMYLSAVSVHVLVSCVCTCTFQVIVHLKMQKGKSVPKTYTQDFQRAEHTFLYQLVFDPRIQKQVRLNPLPDHVNPAEFEFAGTYPHRKCFPIFSMYLSLFSLTAAQRGFPP